MSNMRVFYPIQAVLVNDTAMHGVQSVQLNTTFNLEQVFELGQLELYENVENQPDIEMTIERVLDGYPLLFTKFTESAASGTLLSRSNERSDMHLLIYSDDNNNSEGTPLSQVTMSGMYIESITYNFPVEGTATEQITLVGNDKVWAVTKSLSGVFGDDSPLATGGVQRRQHVQMGSGNSIWPTEIPGIDAGGFNAADGDTFQAHIQDVSVTVNLNREDLFELGKKNQYFRYANFPVSVETTINISPGGDNPGDQVDALSDQDNLTNQQIKVMLDDGSIFDLGTKNKLQSINHSGGDTDGGVVQIAYTYQNFNILTVTSP